MDDLALDIAAFQWREALDAATDGLDNLSRSRQALHLSTAELHARAAQLERERDTIERDLERLAATTHTHLHRHMHGPRARGALLGLGTAVEACVLELDGVLAPSTALHAAAWQETFDELLMRHPQHAGGRSDPWQPFDTHAYFRYVHGRPRIDGVDRFLDSRGIRLPKGDPREAPGYETAWGVAARKNEVLQRLLHQQGIRAYEGSLRFLELAHEGHLALAVVSASANTREILERAGLLALADEVIE